MFLDNVYRHINSLYWGQRRNAHELSELRRKIMALETWRQQETAPRTVEQRKQSMDRDQV